MEAGSALVPGRSARRAPGWVTGLVPLLVLGLGIALFVALGAPGLERRGVPLEELVVERTELTPGEIRLHVVNDGPDPVSVQQVLVNDAFAAFSQSDDSVGRLGSGVVTVEYPWLEGENYEVALLTSTGATIDASVEAATLTPRADVGFYGLMALIGLYVGVIPVAIGMLWLPWVRRIDPRWIRFVLALTVGLLLFLAIDAVLDGTELVGEQSGVPQAYGGAGLVYLGAVAAYLALSGVDAFLRGRQRRLAEAAPEPSGVAAESPGVAAASSEGASGSALAAGGKPRARAAVAAGPFKLAFLVALGIGLHNLGEGLAIGSAYAVGSLALGASLIVGFALHNTTEGLAIVAPVAEGREPVARRLPRLAGLGLLAGAPAILGAWIGASAFDPSLAAFMFGLGAGAIIQVVVQLAPSIRDSAGRLLHPVAVGGLLAGLGIMYLTGLLIAL